MRISDWSSDMCSSDLIDGACLDLGDAAARADRLVVDLVAGGGVVVGRPLGDQRKDERCAGAGNVGGDLVAGVGRCVCTRSVGFAGLRLVARRLARGDEQQRGQSARGGAEAGRVHVGSAGWRVAPAWVRTWNDVFVTHRSEEHTSEIQSLMSI